MNVLLDVVKASSPMKLVLNDGFHDISRDVHLTYTSESDRGFCPFIHDQALKREILELVTDDLG